MLRQPKRTGNRYVSIHGGAVGQGTKEYSAWKNMRRRCLNPKNSGYLNYGGRGIVVCNRWLFNFENFISDMGPCPPGMTLDRVNNAGNYTPFNCKWSTRKEQARNTRVVKLTEACAVAIRRLRWAGVPVKSIARDFGVSKTLIRAVCSGKAWA